VNTSNNPEVISFFMYSVDLILVIAI
jgi:hypothetical protein